MRVFGIGGNSFYSRYFSRQLTIEDRFPFSLEVEQVLFIDAFEQVSRLI
jgi:hypothetical protein